MRPGGPTAVEIEITTPDEVTAHVFDFRPVPPKEAGHVALAHNSGTMFAELDFFALDEPTIRFGFRATSRFGEDVTENLEAARFLQAFFTHTKVVFRCRHLFPGGELEGTQPIGTKAERDHLVFRRRIYEDLALIEERCEIDFVLAELLSKRDLEAILTVGDILRSGTGTATFGWGEGIVSADNIPRATELVREQGAMTRPVEFTVLGHHLNLGMAEYELPPLKVVEIIPHGTRPDAPARVKVAADGDGQMRFRLIDAPSKAAA